jgi:hypothetical protein
MAEDLRRYSDMEGGYQAEIIRRKKINPNDPTIPELESLRNEKLAANPELAKKYGSPSNSGTLIASVDSSSVISAPKEKASSDISVVDKPKAVNDYFGKAADKYTSPYSDKIQSFVNDILNYKPFDPSEYDVNDDPAFAEFKKKATKLGNKAYDSAVAGMSIPGFQDSSIGRQVAESARGEYMGKIQDAIPEFMERARQEHNQGLVNKYNALNALEALDNTGFNRHVSDREFDYKNLTNYITNTGYMPVNTSSIAADDPLRQYASAPGGYQGEIDRRKAINPNDPIIPVLEALRYETVMSDPKLMQQYGSTLKTPMGIQTLAGQADQQQKTAADIELQYLPEKLKLEIDKLRKDIEQIGKTPVLTQYEKDMQDVKLKTARAELDSVLRDNDAIVNAYSTMARHGKDAVTFVMDNEEDLKDKLGEKEYDRLLKSAEQVVSDAESKEMEDAKENKSWWQW